MFPFIRLFAPFRYYVISFVFISLIGYQASQLLATTTNPIQTDDPRLADVVSYEELLRQKTALVLQRFGAEDYSTDLSVTLDHATITTTTFDPGDRQSQLTKGETWQEEVSTSPQVRCIKVCVTLPKTSTLDQDQLFRSLSFALGIDLSRGDMLRIVVL